MPHKRGELKAAERRERADAAAQSPVRRPVRPLLRAARAVGATLQRRRRWTRVAAVGVFVYVAIIAVTGGIDVMLGPIRFRSHETDWLVRLALLAALADLLAGDTAVDRLAQAIGALREAARAAAPAVLRVAVGLSVVAAVLWIVARLVIALPAETPEGDMALLELYTRAASRYELLVGPYSRFQWNHPGPAMFYLFAPLYDLTGGRFESLRASALLLNVACLAGTLGIIRRYGGPALLLAGSVGLALHLLRVPDVLASPWNPHLQLLPLALLLVSFAAVVDGHAPLALLAVASGSFIVQSHLGVAPMVAAVMAAMFAGLLARSLQSPDRAASRRWANAALWLAIALWLPPLSQELASSNGNLSAVYKSFLEEPAPGPVPSESYAAFFQSFAWFLLPGFSTAWGGLIIRSVSISAFVLSMAILLGLVWAANLFRGRGNRFAAALSFVLLGSSAVALWSVLRIQGEIFDQLTFWITILGVLGAACVGAALLDSFGQDAPARRRLVQRAATGIAVAVVAIVTAVGAAELYDRNAAQTGDPAGGRIRDAAAEVEGYLSRERVARPLVRVAQPTWGHAAGVVLALEKLGRELSVEPDWAFMFGPAFTPSGDEDCELVFADPERRRLLEGDQRYTVIAEWPDLSIHAARMPRPGPAESRPVS